MILWIPKLFQIVDNSHKYLKFWLLSSVFMTVIHRQSNEGNRMQK